MDRHKKLDGLRKVKVVIVSIDSLRNFAMKVSKEMGRWLKRYVKCS